MENLLLAYAMNQNFHDVDHGHAKVYSVGLCEKLPNVSKLSLVHRLNLSKARPLTLWHSFFELSLSLMYSVSGVDVRANLSNLLSCLNCNETATVQLIKLDELE